MLKSNNGNKKDGNDLFYSDEWERNLLEKVELNAVTMDDNYGMNDTLKINIEFKNKSDSSLTLYIDENRFILHEQNWLDAYAETHQDSVPPFLTDYIRFPSYLVDWSNLNIVNTDILNESIIKIGINESYIYHFKKAVKDLTDIPKGKIRVNFRYISHFHFINGIKIDCGYLSSKSFELFFNEH